jgi:putative resolvase
MEKYVSGKKACDILGVHTKTLHNWDRDKLIQTIRTPGNKRLYNVGKFLENHSVACKNDKECKFDKPESNKKLNICYARVSSVGQKDDLERQKEIIKNKYPKHTMIEDIGSGINLNRKGLRRIIKLAIGGKINEVIILHKDRLTRFGYELIEDIIKEYSDGEIIVMEQKERMEPEDEIVRDVMELMNVFVAKVNGLRKSRRKNKL